MWVRLISVLLVGVLTGGSGALLLDRPAPRPVAATPAPRPGEPPPQTVVTGTPSPVPSATTTTPAAATAAASAAVTTPAVPPPATSTPAPTNPPRATAAATRPASAAGTRLSRRLHRLMARHGPPDNPAVSVVDATRSVVYERRAQRPALPASTQKLMVAAAALVVFDRGHRYQTTVHATAPVRRGVVRGDLVLVGGADPVLASPNFARVEPSRPRTSIAGLADQVRDAGVRRVTGRVLADPRVLGGEPEADGWLPRYFDSLDAARVSGLTIDRGRRLFPRGGRLQAEAARDPAHQAAAVLTRLLRQRGVRVERGPRVARRSPGSGPRLGRVTSPRMTVLLREMVQNSDNAIADTIHRSLGAASGDPSWRGSQAAVQVALAPLQLDWTGVVMADGSGLSRSNRASAAFLARLQAGMWSSSLADRWRPLMAVSGRSGTLRGRLIGTVAEGRLHGKTGSLVDVRSLAGTVSGPQGDVSVAVVGNGLGPAGSERVRTLTDRMVVVVAEEVLGCRRVRTTVRRQSRKGPRTRVTLVCPQP